MLSQMLNYIMQSEAEAQPCSKNSRTTEPFGIAIGIAIAIAIGSCSLSKNR
jgi:hypothetical protein